jgi:hypothetical protein
MVSPLGRRGNPLTGEVATVKGLGAVAAAAKRDDPVTTETLGYHGRLVVLGMCD